MGTRHALPRKELRKMATWMTRYVEAWDRLDEASASAFHAEDGICEDVMSDKVYKGREELAGWVRSVKQSSPDCRFSVVSEQQCGDWYAIEWEAVGTNTGEVDGRPPTNKPFLVRGVSVGQLDESGEIKVDREYCHLRELGQVE
jgi:steroid delta-isomerase-like uncharacterized protein